MSGKKQFFSEVGSGSRFAIINSDQKLWFILVTRYYRDRRLERQRLWPEALFMPLYPSISIPVIEI